MNTFSVGWIEMFSCFFLIFFVTEEFSDRLPYNLYVFIVYISTLHFVKTLRVHPVLNAFAVLYIYYVHLQGMKEEQR